MSRSPPGLPRTTPFTRLSLQNGIDGAAGVGDEQHLGGRIGHLADASNQALIGQHRHAVCHAVLRAKIEHDEVEEVVALLTDDTGNNLCAVQLQPRMRCRQSRA